MRHPTAQLTDYVDGALDPAARAEVDAHVQGCATCRREIRLALGGKRAADILEAPDVPTGLADAALAEAERLAATGAPEVRSISSSSPRRPNAQRWLAVAGAAAVIAIVALVGPKLGNAPTTDTASMAAGTGAAPYPTATAVEIQHANYSLSDLPREAEQQRAALAAADAGGAVAGSAEGPTTSSNAFAATTVRVSMKRLADATACLDRAFGETPGSPARVIMANYQGESAYFGVYLEGPGGGLPPNLLTLDVAAVHGCRLLAQSTARL